MPCLKARDLFLGKPNRVSLIGLVYSIYQKCGFISISTKCAGIGRDSLRKFIIMDHLISRLSPVYCYPELYIVHQVQIKISSLQWSEKKDQAQVHADIWTWALILRSHQLTAHRCKKNYKYLCFAIVIVFFAEYLALAGLKLLAQLSYRIHHVTALNLEHVKKLG